MPRPFIKPLIKLSKEQYLALLKRIFEKESKITPEVGRGLVGRFEPPVERQMGSLFRDVQLGGELGVPTGESIRRVERLPIAEARAKYFANPEEFVTPSMGEPSVKQLSVLNPPEGVQLGSEEMAKRVAFERLNFQPIVPGGTRRAAGILQKEVTAGAEPAPISQVMQTALIADSLWKEMGGARSVAGKLWQRYLESASGGAKQAFKTGRDYFISCFNKWRTDPSKFKSGHPREARMLEETWKTFQESLGGM